MTTAIRSCNSAGFPSNVIALFPRTDNGDPVDWDEVLLQYGALVSATVRSFQMQDADTLDAVQMTWLRLAENAHQVQFPERLGGWLATTARRECLRILRQTNPAQTYPALDNVADHATGPEQCVIDADIRRTLWDIVAELPPRRRTLLQALFTDHPQPYDEVARTAGIPPGAIGPTRARALRQLRGKLNEHGLGLDSWG
ncbi:MAG: RNA polymerase sigma factor [Pseudonocardiaceae bacterium]